MSDETCPYCGKETLERFKNGEFCYSCEWSMTGPDGKQRRAHEALKAFSSIQNIPEGADVGELVEKAQKLLEEAMENVKYKGSYGGIDKAIKELYAELDKWR